MIVKIRTGLIKSFRKLYPRGRKHEIRGYRIFPSGRKNGVHRQGVGIMMNREAAKSCLGWEDISN